MSAVLSLNSSYYEALKRLTLELAGVNLGSDHAFLIETRLAVLARVEGVEKLEDLIEELFSTGQTRLAVRVVSCLLERDTHFYSDRESFDLLEEVILPTLYTTHKGNMIRILSFGCSSGQEPYSVMMMARRCFEKFDGMRIEVTGVDYPSSALERAKIGRYTHFDVQRGLPARDLVTYFDRHGEDWQIKPSIRERVVFRETHLLSNLSDLGAFEVVLFRNALPHYSSPAQVRVIRGLSGLVQPRGFLLLGSNEDLEQLQYGFDPLAGHPNILRKHEARVEVKEEPVDPNIKKPSGRKTFDKSPYVPPTGTDF